MKKLCWVCVAGVLALAVPVPADAASFSRSDRNRDGLVSYEEAYRSMDRIDRVHFDKCDRDGDGFINKAEFGCLAGIYDMLYRNR